ncbi:MAG: hypothetical protein AB7K09_25815 [Planctomycetota bacterium]
MSASHTGFHFEPPPDVTPEQWAEMKDTYTALVGATVNFLVMMTAILALGFLVFHVWGTN